MKDFATSFDGVPIHYEVHGTGVPALVFVHGWCCNRTHWEKQLDHFARQHQVVAIDLGGHGKSGLGRRIWNMPAFGQDVAAVVQKLGLRQVALVGHSMGGAVIVEAAHFMPDRLIGLVGVDTYRNLGETRLTDEIDRFLAPLRANFLETTQKFVCGLFTPNSDTDLVHRIVAQMSATPPEVGIGAMQGYSSNDLNLITGLRELQKLNVPIIAINSDYWPGDIETSQRYGVRTQFMSRVGHFVMMEDPDTFNRLLDEAVRELVGANALG